MGGGKETPRQKMIGMMYLVLTALLAMNVSKQILQGYLSVNESLVKSKKNLEENNARVTEAFKATINGNKGAEPYFNRALEAQKMINETYKYIGDLRSHVMNETEELKNIKIADTLNLRSSQKMDDYDMPTTILIGSEPKTPKKGANTASELKDKLNGLHDKLVAMLDKMQKTDGEHLLDADYQGLKKKIASIKPVDSKRKEDGVEFNWEMDNFYHLPLAAVYTSFNKMQADLKNVEAEILQVFSGASGKLAIKFDRLAAKVIAPSAYIQQGQKYTADIFLAASSSQLGGEDMKVLIGVDSAAAAGGATGTPVDIVGGMGKYEGPTGGVGEQTYKGVIKYKNPDGTFKYYPFEGSYMVAAPAVAVSADQMNVFYAGVENPVTVSAAGVAPTDLIVNPSGCGVSKTGGAGGKFIFKFTGAGECNVAVSAKQKDGSTKPQGTVKFRVKALPAPVASVGGKSGFVEMPKSGLSAIGGMGANAPGFDFKANYIVLSFDVTGSIKGQTKFTSCQGNNLNADARAILSAAGTGSKIFFDNIKVKKPDGTVVSGVPGVTIKVK